MSRSIYIIIPLIVFFITDIQAQKSNESISTTDPIAKKMVEMTKYTGFQTYYWDAKEGKIWLEIEKWDEVFNQLIQLAINPSAAGQVKSVARYKIDRLKYQLTDRMDDEENEGLRAHFYHAIKRIEQFQINPEDFKIDKPAKIPAGSPIGSLHMD